MGQSKHFSKLYKVPLPYPEVWRQQVSTYCQVDQYAHLVDCLSAFDALYEEDENPKGLQYLMIKILSEKIRQTKAFEALDGFRVHGQGPTKVDKRTSNYDTDLISVDMVEANWSCIRNFQGPDKTWVEFLQGQDVHEAFQRSKYFRQVIFGQLTPKRMRQFQAVQMQKVSDRLEAALGAEVVFRQADEVQVKKSAGVTVENVQEALSGLLGDALPLRVEEFRLEVGRFGTKVMCKPGQGPRLYGVPATRHPALFALLILGRHPTEGEKTFIHDGIPAKWLDL